MVLGHPPQPGGRALLGDCWGGAATLMDTDGDQHCIHLASLGGGWQEETGSGPCVRNNAALLACVTSFMCWLEGVRSACWTCSGLLA